MAITGPICAKPFTVFLNRGSHISVEVGLHSYHEVQSMLETIFNHRSKSHELRLKGDL